VPRDLLTPHCLRLIPACKRYGLDVVVYNPIAGGLFSGKYKTKDIPKEGRYSDAVGRMGEMYRKRYFKDSTFEALKIIERKSFMHLNLMSCLPGDVSWYLFTYVLGLLDKSLVRRPLPNFLRFQC
jgi:hypothetical protein